MVPLEDRMGFRVRFAPSIGHGSPDSDWVNLGRHLTGATPVAS